MLRVSQLSNYIAIAFLLGACGTKTQDTQNDKKTAQKTVSQEPDAMELLANEMAGDSNEDVLAAFLRKKSGHPGASKYGHVFDAGPRQMATLIPNRVQLKLPITSCKPVAVPFLNQGFTHMHAFEIIEAERDFRQALYLDESCIMAIWGAGFANTLFDAGNWARAKKFARLASELAASRKTPLSNIEQTLLTELAVFTADHRREGAGKRFVQSWIDLMKANPNESELAAFSAHLIWNNQLITELGYTNQEVSDWIDKVIKDNPRHPAHHHMIHLWNDREHESNALNSADLIGASLLDSAHLWHMGSHIYYNLGKAYESDEQFSRAAYLDQVQSAARMEFPSSIHNYGHNQNFWITVLSYLGSQRKAYEMAENLLALPLDRHTNNPKLSTSTYMTPFLQGLDGLDTLARGDGRPDLLLKLEAKGVLDIDASQMASKNLVAWTYFNLAWVHLEQSGDRDARYQELRQKISSITTLKVAPLLQALDAKELWMRNGPSEKIVDEWMDLHFDGTPVFYNRARLAKYYREAGAFEKAYELFGSITANAANLIECALAQINTGRIEEAKKSLSKSAERASQMDTDNPAYALGQQVAAKLGVGSVTQDWRKAHTPRNLALNLPAGYSGTKFIAPKAPDFSAWNAVTKQRVSLNQTLNLAPHGVVLAFVLGGACTRCNEQLIALEAHRLDLEAAGYKIMAVTSDSAADMELIPAEYRPGFDVLSDDSMNSFRAYRAFDEFESKPLHGLFVIEKDHSIKFLNRGSMPYLEISDLVSEIKRLSKF